MREYSCSLAVVTNSASIFYRDYVCFIRPYLVHFGFPFREIDVVGLAAGGNYPVPACAAIVLGHDGLGLDGHWEAHLSRFLEQGTGIVSFDSSRTVKLPGETFSPAITGDAEECSIEIAEGAHYISALHTPGEVFACRAPLRIDRCGTLDGGTVIARLGSWPLLSVAQVGSGRVVAWSSYAWISPALLGPFAGLDDLIWRSIVWAARKPFVMQGFPPMVTMRVDDVWGSSRSGRADDPLHWVGTANRYGVKPWLGLFLDNMNSTSIESCRRYVNDGRATSFPHAFAGYDQSTGAPIQEELIYFDHWRMQDYHDAVLRRNTARVEEWHRRAGIPIGKAALAHYYEIGSNALPVVIGWGCEFTGVHMPPGEPFRTPSAEGPWLPCGPFRNFVTGRRKDPLPCYYADYLRVDGRPDMSGRLFNCVTEVRDITGYEWAPTNDTRKSIDNGVAQLRRAFDAMALGSLFTHESDYLQHITPGNWETILKGVCAGIEEYHPRMVTLEEGCAYARARHDTRIAAAYVDGVDLHLDLAGTATIPTQAYLFDGAGDEIISRQVDIPAPSSGSKAVLGRRDGRVIGTVG